VQEAAHRTFAEPAHHQHTARLAIDGLDRHDLALKELAGGGCDPARARQSEKVLRFEHNGLIEAAFAARGASEANEIVWL
jgi:hypothetical protein